MVKEINKKLIQTQPGGGLFNHTVKLDNKENTRKLEL